MRSLGLGGGPPYSSRLGAGQSEVTRHQGSARGHPDTYRDFVEAEEDVEAGPGGWIPMLLIFQKVVRMDRMDLGVGLGAVHT